MPSAPYLMFGFDVDPSDPGAPAIIDDVKSEFPPIGTVIPLGVANMYTVDVPSSQSFTRFSQLNTYFRTKDTAHGGVLRWVIQLCEKPDFGEG